MSQEVAVSNAAMPVITTFNNSAFSTYIKDNLTCFHKEGKKCDLAISDNGEGPFCVIDGMEYSLLDGSFNMMLVQTNHGARDAKFKKHAGEIYVDDIEIFSEQRKLIPICIVREGRNMFPPFKGGDEENAPICRSRNGLTPVLEKGVLPNNSICAVLELGTNGKFYKKVECPHAKWDGDKKAECQNYFDVAFLDITDREVVFPVVMRIKSTAISAWRSFRNSFDQVARVSRITKKRLENYYISLSSEDKGNYCVPVFKLEYGDGADSPAKFYQIATWYRDNLFETVIKNEAEREAEAQKAASFDSNLEAIDVDSLSVDKEDESVGFSL